jgi:hypothetical protein
MPIAGEHELYRLLAVGKHVKTGRRTLAGIAQQRSRGIGTGLLIGDTGIVNSVTILDPAEPLHSQLTQSPARNADGPSITTGADLLTASNAAVPAWSTVADIARALDVPLAELARTVERRR